MQITYTGPSTTGVVIAVTGQHAEHGVPLEVDDAVAVRLLEQDVWAEPEGKKGRAAASTDNAATAEEV